ncbi:MAG: TRAP transporter permease [Pseudomonadota bacterium]
MSDTDSRVVAGGIDEEPPASYERDFRVKWVAWAVFAAGIFYAGWHLWVLNIAPLETWTFRILHVAGGLSLGFALAVPLAGRSEGLWKGSPEILRTIVDWIAAVLVLYALAMVVIAWFGFWTQGVTTPPDWVFANFGPPLISGICLAVLSGWVLRSRLHAISRADWVLIAASVTVAGFILFSLDNLSLRLRAGTAFADPQNGWAALAGVLLILELTRRVAGMALVVIAGLFVIYAFVGPWLPGFLSHSGYEIWRFFTYVYTDNGILGPTTAVSSTYIILFIIFAAFLSASKVGDYFVNFAFAAAGHARGGPAKVAVFASGLMGMINGTSAGNVVATGSLTIPLMKRVGYPPRSAGAIEAAASTGGQIMPPIMGAGAFIMAEITGIPYTELVIAAIIPAILYFTSVYFMVDFEARKLGMQGLPRSELPVFSELVKQAYLFIPIIILIGALFTGYSVIRAGTYATVAAAVVSWLTPHRMGPKQLLEALALASKMAVQIIAVCACAGIIVGVISLTGVGARFSSLLLGVAEASQLLALIFAMCISIILGMGMPTTAAYAVAASVVAPGLIALGIEPLIAHFFVFYFAVISAITPPVALAAYAGGAIAGANPMRTSVESFKIGIAAFVVPFMFFYNSALLMEGPWLDILRAFVTASIGVFFLACAAQGWFLGRTVGLLLRLPLLAAALLFIEGSLLSDAIGIGLAIGVFVLRRVTGGGAVSPMAEQVEPAQALTPARDKPSAEGAE